MTGSPVPATSASDSWWTEERARLHDWFQKTAPELATVYVGGLSVLMDEELPGRVHFAAHAMREIANRLRDVLTGTDAKRPQYADLVEHVRQKWVDADLPIGNWRAVSERASPSASGPVTHRVSEQLLSAVAKLVDKHAGAPPTNKERLRRLFLEVGGQDQPPTEVVDGWVESWSNVTERGARLAHVGKEPLGPDAEAKVEALFLAFERSVMAIANRSYENLDALDRLLASANQR